MKDKKTLRRLLGAALFLLIIAALSFVYVTFSEQGVSGRKGVTITVISSAGESLAYDVRTDALYLRGAMEDADGLSFEGTDGPFGMMISSVNGESAVYEKDGAYWSFSVNGQYCTYGVDDQPIHDGDAFTIAYTR